MSAGEAIRPDADAVPADADRAVAAFARCRTAADFYRLQIGIEDEWLPGQVDALRARAADLTPRLHKWLDTLGAMAGAPDERAEAHARTVVSRNVWLLGGPAATRQARSVVLAFCGNSNRMMMPLCAFLRHIPAGRFDVVLLRTGDRSMYLAGVPGYAPDLAQVLERLEADLGLSGYASIRCMGTSGGGAASLVATELLGARRGLCVGGGHPSMVASRLAERGLDGDALDRLLPATRTAQAPMTLCFGAQADRDREGAQSLLRVFPWAKPLPIPGVDSHNPLDALRVRGVLGRFIERELLSEPPRMRAAALRNALLAPTALAALAMLVEQPMTLVS